MSETDSTGRATRREFLVRGLKAAATIAAAGALGYRFRETGAPAPAASAPLRRLPRFAVKTDGPQMAVARGADRIASVNRALDALGGMPRFIVRGDRVLIKVNAAFATPARLGATTDPGLLAEVVRLCRAAGAAEVIVTDNPINAPESCFDLTGIGEAARRAGARVAVPREPDFAPHSLDGGALIRDWPVLLAPFEGVTKVIGMTPVKDHYRAGASLSMKNWYGLLGGRRNVFHQDINETIKELALLVTPTLVILDGTTSMMRNGPTGGSTADLEATDTMIVSTDQVAADAFGATLLGRRSSDLPYITKASMAGAGTANYELLNPIMVTT